MKYNAEWYKLNSLLTPLCLRIVLALADKPHTKSEMYNACITWNNKVVKDNLDVLQEMGYIKGGDGRGVPYSLTVSGVTFSEWLLEGVLYTEPVRA